MKILLFRSNNIFDSRVNKYHNYYERAHLDYTIVGWDRAGKGWTKEHYDFFQYRAGESVGGWRAIHNHFKWMLFVFKYLKQHKDVTTIHACDLNSAFPAAIFKTLHKREVTLIFDACDWFSANFASKKFLCFSFELMERYTCRKADTLIICEPERVRQIRFKLKKEPLIMRNIPEIETTAITKIQKKYKFDNAYPTIAYMGGLVVNRFLEELLKLAETEPFNLLIAGSGDSMIVNKCVNLSKRDNVRYFGRVHMDDGLNMENAADVIYAMYCKINPNHIYAAPNKYYEALLLGKPLITTAGTIVGDKVQHFDIGWAIEEDINELKRLLNKFTMTEIKKKGDNALFLWEKQYKNDIFCFFENIYPKVIR